MPIFFVSFPSVWIEKKLLRNIPVNEKATTTVEKPWVDKRDASTATEDLGVNAKISLFVYLYLHNYIFLADLKCIFI
jgi:hypothetical protein